ncbi:MAG: Asp-tRNA(Asn)/Glu-tRNA(Gln) amidotransferase subunit GatB [Clostridiales bacterium]|nr:Asp-tRNA(Asn)/Glu-tRNA(Gln) amidotransferase subunit GatB [Clostridiales bacterium]
MEFEAVIGLEIHCELKTKTKNFCSCKNEFGFNMNTNVCPVCLGLPGALPVPNKTAFEYCIKAGLSFGCDINDIAIFERKNYFYPDLPKAYQISQLEKPICLNGCVEFEEEGLEKSIRLNRIHLEEDAGKSIHDNLTNSSLIDLNRSSVPLIEIVTEPDIRSSSEAVKVLETIKETLKYIDVSDCKMQEGSLRCDVNVSIREKGTDKLNTRTEMKNLSSFKAVQRAIDFEIQRQIEMFKNGEKLTQETLRWDDEKGVNYSLRSKEESNDYKYFPDPDLLPIKIERDYVSKIKNNLPRLPKTRRKQYIEEFNLPEYDAKVLTNDKQISDFFEETLKQFNNPKQVSNLIMSDILRLIKQNELNLEEKLPFSIDNFVKLLKMLDSKEITRTSCTTILENIFITNEDAIKCAERLNLKVNDNEDEILQIVLEVIKNNPNAVQDYKNGNERTLTFFMGQVMKASRGRAKPDTVTKLIKENLK